MKLFVLNLGALRHAEETLQNLERLDGTPEFLEEAPRSGGCVSAAPAALELNALPFR